MTAPDYFPILTDHLGTPRKVLDKNGNTRWSWDAKEPFGNVAPLENPGALGVFKFNLRFPGQWFDQETGLHHNGFRDFHPGLGRYVQSDPLGLEAGWNTYGYVGGSPLGYSDPYGLDYVQDVFDYLQPPAVPQGVVDFSAGVGDDISFGLTAVIRTQVLGNNSVDICSSSYMVGGYASILAMPIKGGVTKLVKGSLGTYGPLSKVKGLDAHHIFQDAAMRNIPGYDPRKAPSILLQGPSTRKLTEHSIATGIQRNLKHGGGTYASERRISYRALRSAGYSSQKSKEAIRYADGYFEGLGVNMNTPTRIPGNRR